MQSKAGPDGKPLPEAALIEEQARLVEALERLDANIATARTDLQTLTRPDERELFESRLIILQVRLCAWTADLRNLLFSSYGTLRSVLGCTVGC